MAKESAGSERLYNIIFLFFLLSFAGWCAETLYFLARWQEFADRGFLTLPLCTIYGSSALLVYFALGTPRGGRLAPLYERTARLRIVPKIAATAGLYLLYFIFAALLPAAAEFFVALFFDKLCGVKLWDYSYRPYNLCGYVCLSQTILWGLLLTLGMSTAWDPLYAAVNKIPQRAKKILIFTLTALALADLAVNAAFLAVTGTHFLLF